MPLKSQLLYPFGFSLFMPSEFSFYAVDQRFSPPVANKFAFNSDFSQKIKREKSSIFFCVISLPFLLSSTSTVCKGKPSVPSLARLVYDEQLDIITGAFQLLVSS